MNVLQPPLIKWPTEILPSQHLCENTGNQPKPNSFQQSWANIKDLGKYNIRICDPHSKQTLENKVVFPESQSPTNRILRLLDDLPRKIRKTKI